MLHNYLLEEFNVNLTKVVYDTDKEERFNLMLTSGDYPEVMTGLSKSDVAGVWELKAGYKEDDNHKLTHWVNTPEGKEFTAYYNQVHRDGLFDPDAFSNKYDDWKSKFSNQRIIGHIGPWWQSWNAGHEVWQKTDDNWIKKQRFV